MFHKKFSNLIIQECFKDCNYTPLQADIPDGHRAPIPQSSSGTRSIDTQTPCRSGGTSRESRSSESPASPHRPRSISPAIPIIAGLMENSPRPSSSYDSPIGSTSGNKSDKEGNNLLHDFHITLEMLLNIALHIYEHITIIWIYVKCGSFIRQHGLSGSCCFTNMYVLLICTCIISL